MEIPSFSELSKGAREILNSGYEYGKGVIKVSLKTKTKGKFEVDVCQTVDSRDSQGQGEANAKVKLKNFGTVSEKWYSDGTLNLDYEIVDKPIRGLSVTAGIIHNPRTSISGGKLGTKFKNDIFNLGCSISNTLDSNFKLFGGAVVGVKDLLIGYQIGYETEEKLLTKSDIGLTYKFKNAGFHFKCSPGISEDYGTSIYYKANENLEAALSGNVTTTNNSEYWTCGIGTKCKLDETSTLRLKLDTELQLGASIQQLAYDGIHLTLAFGVDLNDIFHGSHRIGLAVDIEA